MFRTSDFYVPKPETSSNPLTDFTPFDPYQDNPLAEPSDKWGAAFGRSKNYLINKKDEPYKMNYTPGSIGINIPQVLVAGIEDALITKGNIKNALVASASVGISNLLPSYGPTGMWSSGTEKYIAEPIIAGLLYSFGSQYMRSGEKEGSFVKRFGKGFIIGASSAAIGGQLVGSTLATRQPYSQYSSRGGLRQTQNIDTGTQTIPAVITTPMPSFIVS